MPWGWRSDGDLVRDLTPARRIMPFLMRSKTDSMVFLEQQVDTTKTWRFIQTMRERTGLHVTLLHVLIWAVAQALHVRPRLNRFTAGRRIYQRRGIWISFSAKKDMTDADPIFVVKRRIDPTWSLERVAREVDAGVVEGRSDQATSTDRELALIFKLPTFAIDWLVRLLLRLDHWGLLPGFFIQGDPFFASVFIANLGSIGMDAGFHHLYQYGNIPIFVAAGQRREQVVPGPDGRPVVRSLVTLRYSFDERVEDALYGVRALELFRLLVEDPESHSANWPPAEDENDGLAAPGREQAGGGLV